ncbi:MAG: SidJ-related pseudokinase [Desulfobacterales bacterium]|uniref:SidJ-related pseudokinase n=1 Tax=Candidatus Desulfaltia bathyphila TaxID=2841697 RepID=A0A8J6N4I2_9BACT|nr:SidJ-related pseudokinase [Candidatus Desulfaltia bathyphila]MBL7194942.1 SidJ-related pseudokinase [Desulfobacterales bacterium]MBL7207464.1 SidJ-related pseudokinase [Desulfobacterales bacterium]
MYYRNPERERSGLENALKSENLDFSAAFMVVQDLHQLVQARPEIIRPETISALENVLEDSKHTSQTQSFFLYREAADALASILVLSVDEPLSKQSISSLKHVVNTGSGMQQRAVTEAMGSLPLQIRGPRIPEDSSEKIPRAKWNDVLKLNNIAICDTPVIRGRSLVASINNNSKILVVKFAVTESAVELIKKEAEWMHYLSSYGHLFPVRFKIPQPVQINGSYLFRLKNLPVRPPVGSDINPKYNYAIAYIAHKDYFTYPNDHRKARQLTKDKFREVILRNAWLLGKLTSLGIVHSAPIPLFHNRVQRNRRADHGIYEWHHGGRLDRWLHSCRYPNFGITGIRDFEHLISYQGSSRDLYRHIGSHILSLALVTGSYFRNFKADKVGFDEHGKPLDVRYLFDKSFLKELLQGIFQEYYNGFVEEKFCGDIPFDIEQLSARMIEEMGVDRHMEEMLRVVDQMEMTENEFKDFLAQRGCSEEEIEGYKKDVNDIAIQTGPHLGGFNQRISVPELIQCIGAVSAYCIGSGYLAKKG